MTRPLHVRPAVAADEAVLGRLGALLVGVHHDIDPRRFLAVRPGTERGYGRFLTGRIGRPEEILLVVEREGEVLGYAWAALEGESWMDLRGPAGVIHDVVVDPASRRTGAGTALVEAAAGWLESRGAPRVVLSTAAGNRAAGDLFLALGFRRTMVEMTREAGERGHLAPRD